MASLLTPSLPSPSPLPVGLGARKAQLLPFLSQPQSAISTTLTSVCTS